LPEILQLAVPTGAAEGESERPPRPPLHPVTWKMDVLEAANNAAKVQVAARQPAIQEQAAQSPEIDTHPLLGADGEPPKTVDELMRAAHLWESAAVEAIGDPRFTLRPTDLPRNELTKISRGPLWQDLWVEQHTYKPVLFSGETDAWVRNTSSQGAHVPELARIRAMMPANAPQEAASSPTRHAAPPASQAVSPSVGKSSASRPTSERPISEPSPAGASPAAAGLPAAFLVGVRNVQHIIENVVRVVAPRVVSDVGQVCDEKLDRLRYELWTEERRTGLD
jgi:hypothetical protein